MLPSVAIVSTRDTARRALARSSCLFVGLGWVWCDVGTGYMFRCLYIHLYVFVD